MYVPDSIDRNIIRVLGLDTRQSTETLAKKLNISGSTVRRRLRLLSKHGLLHFPAHVKIAEFGLPLAAILALNITPDKLESSMKKLAEMEEIYWFSTTTGRFDVITRAQFRTTEHLSEFVKNSLSKLEGLQEVETFICLEMKRGDYLPLLSKIES
jgi:DNA-binding Lrp family transcriptional regulator